MRSPCDAASACLALRERAQARSAPLRAYLMAEVIPSLTEGLIEVTKVRPEDPVDYLAEWIFRKNPALE
jgi:adenylate kinase